MNGTLVLSRRTNQGITFMTTDKAHIGHIEIISVKGNQVRIALNFDDDVVIVRDELLEADAAGEVLG